MRLIDADEFEKRIKPYDTNDRVDSAMYSFAHNQMMYTSTAKAIPVEWIKKWLSKKVFIWDTTTMADEKDRLQAIENIKYGFETMLKDWREENGSNR